MDNSIGIYVHVPFCKSKCNYCDFNSYSGRDHLAGPYFDALFSEMKIRAEMLKGRTVRSLFIGGGTPTLVDPKYICSLMELCSKLFGIQFGAEITLESNPGTLTPDNLKAYRAAGINRLSIGLQAWQDRLLKELGRIHDRRQFGNNFEAAVLAGFHNINVDLIFGLPGQSFDEWAETLEEVAKLGDMSKGCVPNGNDSNNQPGSVPARRSGLVHLSCYDLKIEEGTIFGSRYEAGELKPAEDELDRRMYRHTIEYLAGKGFRQYEISNFAIPGYECRHNLIYWKAEEYAGFGAGAHSYLYNTRFSNAEGIEQYIKAVAEIESKEVAGMGSQPDFAGLHEEIQLIDKQDSMSEFMILGLRLTGGVSTEEFRDRYGEDIRVLYGNKLEQLQKRGLLTVEADRIKLTETGLDLANQVFVEFI